MAMALIIQRFDLTMDDPSYNLIYKVTLTVKPAGFNIRAKLRIGRENFPLTPSSLGVSSMRQPADLAAADRQSPCDTPRIYVYYGSNSGSCETFAQRIASDAASHGAFALYINNFAY